MTVYENMRFGLSSLRLPKDEVERRIRAATEMLDLGPYLERKPKQLSGGQRQRVAMGRAVVRQPKVFLFDEPLSNLDAALRLKMRLEIARMRSQLGATGIYVTHDQVEAMTLAHKIVVLRAGQIEQEGPPLEVYQRPSNKFVASFLGSPSMNFIPGDCPGLPEAMRIKPDPSIEFGIRPEHLLIGTEYPHRIQGKVYAVEQLGDQVLAHIRLGSLDRDGNPCLIVARLPGNASVGPQSSISLGFDPAQCHVFDSTGRAVTRA
jgi:ABC-type sugar transport system ATPase subunit